MARKRKTEVLVVGAGPVGLYSALRLTEAGVGVEIVDEQWQTAGRSYALALHAATLERLDEVGLARPLIERGQRVDRVALYDAVERRAEVDLSRISSPFPFIVVLPQNDLESALEKRLREAGARVQWNHQVSKVSAEPAGAVSQVDRLEKMSSGYAVATTEWVVQKSFPVESAFVLGADGHRSMVRQAADIPFPSHHEPELFAVFEFVADEEPGNEVRIAFVGNSTNVLWPLPGGRWRWSFQIHEGEAEVGQRFKSRLALQIGRGAFPQLDESHLKELIEERAGWFTAGIRGVRWSMVVRFERRLAERFGGKSLWIAGDAGHLAGPVGIHSMNVGLKEAHELASTLVRVLRQGVSRDALKSYDEGRLREWRQLLGLEGGLTPADETDPWVAENASRVLACLPASGEHLRQLASQLRLDFRPAAGSH